MQDMKKIDSKIRELYTHLRPGQKPLKFKKNEKGDIVVIDDIGPSLDDLHK
jgi:hypothetical protein